MTADDFGKQAYLKMMSNEHSESVKILSKAINMYPDDKRLYTNRCNNYIRLRDFNSAMLDALHLTENYPTYSKGFYLRAEIHMNLRSYKDAESDYAEVARLVDSNLIEKKLFNAQILQLLEKGYEIDVARKALRLSSSVEEAVQSLSFGLIKKGEEDTREYYIHLTDEEEAFLTKEFEALDKVNAAKVKAVKPAKETTKTALKTEQLMDPTNPLKCAVLYLGNLQDTVTEKKIKIFFSNQSFQSVHHIPDKRIAFVNCSSWEAAGKAMLELQGKPIDNANVIIKYPNYALK